MNYDEPAPVRIDAARLKRLQRACESMQEDLSQLRGWLQSEQREVVGRGNYSFSINVAVDLTPKGLWDATADHIHWERGKPTRHAAITAVLRHELKRLLDNVMKDDE